MLGVFSSAIVTPPDELVAAGSRTPSPKTKAAALVDRFLETTPSSVSVRVGDDGHLAYSHHQQCPFQPRYTEGDDERCRSFAVKDDVFCLFEGALDNVGSLRQQYGLCKTVNEAVLLIEAYKALRDRAPYPPSHVVGHLDGNFAFVVFDNSTSTLFVASLVVATLSLLLFWIGMPAFSAFAGFCPRTPANVGFPPREFRCLTRSIWCGEATDGRCGLFPGTPGCTWGQDQHGKVPLFWGITADGYVAFAGDAELLKRACGKSLAPFPQGCYFLSALGELKCYENPKNKVTAVPANEEEICGATYKVEAAPPVFATMQ
ncbi:hypothetical protein ACLOJK_018572 [Asimina triloba]